MTQEQIEGHGREYGRLLGAIRDGRVDLQTARSYPRLNSDLDQIGQPQIPLLRVALLFTWHGSLLYLGLAESLLALTVIATGDRGLAAAQAASSLLSLALFATILTAFPTPLLGDYSSIAPSRNCRPRPGWRPPM